MKSERNLTHTTRLYKSISYNKYHITSNNEPRRIAINGIQTLLIAAAFLNVVFFTCVINKPRLFIHSRASLIIIFAGCYRFVEKTHGRIRLIGLNSYIIEPESYVVVVVVVCCWQGSRCELKQRRRSTEPKPHANAHLQRNPGRRRSSSEKGLQCESPPNPRPGFQKRASFVFEYKSSPIHR